MNFSATPGANFIVELPSGSSQSEIQGGLSATVVPPLVVKLRADYE